MAARRVTQNDGKRRNLFQSRIARRIFLLFLLCSLLPLGLLAAFAFQHVSASLEEVAQANMHRSCKAVGLALFERLQYLEGELGQVMEELKFESEDPRKGVGSLAADRFLERFNGLALVGPDGLVEWRLGSPRVEGLDFPRTDSGRRLEGEDVLEVDEISRRHLGRGRTLLLTRGRELFFCRLVRPLASFLVAQISPGWLWSREGFDPQDRDLLVFTGDGLTCLHTGTRTSRQHRRIVTKLLQDTERRLFHYDLGKTRQMAQHWDVFMEPTFGRNAIVVISRDEKQVFASLAAFKRIYFLAALLSFFLIILFSSSQIRRSLVPVDELIRGTRMVGRRDFRFRVSIDSGDEFDELGSSFNEMVMLLEHNQEERKRFEAELIEARDRALNAMEAESNFLSNVSHELRTPMTSIRSSAEILRDYEDIDAETGKEFLDVIVEESLRLSRLIDNVLDLRKIHAGRQEWDFQPVRVEETVAEVFRAMSIGARERKVQVEMEVPEPLPVIQADRDRLKQVWTNLLANAIKFSGEGDRVAIGAHRRGEEIVVEVSDQGPGIREEDLEKIFERFCQSSSDLVTDKPGGTGLGLTIAKEIVENHDGRIEVESELGRGARFRVRIPVRVGGAGTERPETVATTGGGGEHAG